jgi:hypothetical protein
LTAEQWGQTAWMDSLMGLRPSRWRLPIFGPNRRRFKRSESAMRMDDHELVIIPRGNLGSPEAYWLQGL